MLITAIKGNGEVVAIDKSTRPGKIYRFSTLELYEAWFNERIKSGENRPL